MTSQEISAFCVDQLGEILRNSRKNTVDVNAKFARLGLDSAMTVYLLMELEDRLDLELSAETFYDHPTVADSVRSPRGDSRGADRTARRGALVQVPMEQFSSLVAVLEHRAATQSDERALIFLTDRGAEAFLTFRELHDAANAVAKRLTAVAKPGDRALLVFPPGLEFIVAFFGCLIARVIAVPMMVPRRQSARDLSLPASWRTASRCSL